MTDIAEIRAAVEAATKGERWGWQELENNKRTWLGELCDMVDALSVTDWEALTADAARYRAIKGNELQIAIVRNSEDKTLAGWFIHWKGKHVSGQTLDAAIDAAIAPAQPTTEVGNG